MKRGTPTHYKMKRLAKQLKVELPMAVGIMEMLWHFTSDQAPRGDIGRMSDEEISEGVAWKKDPNFLIAALIETNWLDKSESHRLIVHDWHQHADNTVKKKLFRSGDTFLTEYGLCQDAVETESLKKIDTVQPRAGKARQGSLVVNNKTNNFSAGDLHSAWKDAEFRSPEEFETWWSEIVSNHPNQNENGPAKIAILELVLAGNFKRTKFESGLEKMRLRAGEDWTKQGGKYCTNLFKIVDGNLWRHALKPLENSGGPHPSMIL